MKKRKELSTSLPRDHWRQIALEHFPEHEEIIASDNEEYAIYNLFFQLRSEFNDAIATRNDEAATEILDFAGRCLQNELESDGENVSVAAGVSLFEHIFEDTPVKHWPAIFSCMALKTYHASRHYVEQWMGPDDFSNVAEAAKEFYTSRKEVRNKRSRYSG